MHLRVCCQDGNQFVRSPRGTTCTGRQGTESEQECGVLIQGAPADHVLLLTFLCPGKVLVRSNRRVCHLQTRTAVLVTALVPSINCKILRNKINVHSPLIFSSCSLLHKKYAWLSRRRRELLGNYCATTSKQHAAASLQTATAIMRQCFRPTVRTATSGMVLSIPQCITVECLNSVCMSKEPDIRSSDGPS